MQFVLTNEFYKASSGANIPTPLTSLTAAKNTTAAFQLVLITSKRCVLSGLPDPALTQEMWLPLYRVEVLSPLETELFTIDYLPDENGILRADVLRKTATEYSGIAPACAYAVVKIPSQTIASDYEITVNLYSSVGASSERLVDTRTLTITVKDYLMPYPKDYSLYLDLWQHSSNVARAYNVPLYSESHFAKLENVIKALSELGQKSVTVLAGDCPWRGWGCYLLKEKAVLYEYSMVTVTEANGSFGYDFTALDRYIRLCDKYNINGDITVYGLTGIWTNMPMFRTDAQPDWSEQILIRYKSENGSYRYMQKRCDIENYITALVEHFKSLGVFHKVRIGSDEPRQEDVYLESVKLLKKIEPNLKFKMALDSSSAIEKFSEITSDIASSFPCTLRDGKKLLALKKQFPDKKLLWYVCNIPDKPNTFLSSDLLECRALAALMHLFNFDGFLRWAFTCWTAKPLEDIRFHSDALAAGDVALVYPLPDGSLGLSLRYHALKRGIEDYELLAKLKRLNETAANNLMSSALINKDFSNYFADNTHTNEGIFSTDFASWEQLRIGLIDALLKEETL